MTLSLTGGTFVLLVRLFAFVAHLPFAGLRKENGKMKIRYEFVTGEFSEIEVDDSLGELLVDFDRQQYNNDHKETRRHVSLDGMEYEGELFASVADTADEVERREELAQLMRAMEALSPSQRELVQKVFFENQKIVDIAREEGVSHAAIHDRLKRIYKKIKNNL